MNTLAGIMTVTGKILRRGGGGGFVEETFEDQEWWIYYIHTCNMDTHRSTHLILEFAVISAGS